MVRLRCRWFELPQQRLGRKLRRAAEHAEAMHGRVDVTSLLRPNSKLVQPSLRRTPTLRLKQQASQSLEAKRAQLVQNLRTLWADLALATLPTPKLQLVVKRDALLDSLRFVANLPYKSLLSGQLMIKFIGEEGQDAGGLFADYMECMAHTIAAAPHLFRPAADGSLLPAPLPGAGKKYSEEVARMQLFAVGRLLALSITRATPFPLPLSRFFFKLALSESITSSDVARVDPEFAKWRVHAVLEPGGVAN
eukprot:2088660-Prymnesium_polylepis.1